MNLSWLSLSDPNTQWVLGGTMLLGGAAGVLGGFALLRKRALMGDTLAHAALPGITIAFLLTGVKSTGLFLVGAALSGALASLLITAILRWSKLKEDTAMGIILSVFFGVGILLLTYIQKLPLGNQSGLDKFLFGQAASIIHSDLLVMATMATILCLTVFLLFKELKLLAFDPQFGRGIGLPIGLLDLLLSAMMTLVVVIGLQAVGVVLMAALLITPPIAARYWTDRLSTMLLLSGLFGALSGAGGTLVSQAGARLATGPLIVLAATLIFLGSLLFAPRRGLLAKLFRFLRLRQQYARDRLLRAIYEVMEGAPDAPVTAADLGRKGIPDRGLAHRLARLERDGLVSAQGFGWRLTDRGLREAYRLVREERLWEVYLMHEADLGGGLTSRDQLGEGAWGPLLPELERLLRLHQLEPVLRPSATEEGA
jgi:manganese/zinc/iron transport system permease protein